MLCRESLTTHDVRKVIVGVVLEYTSEMPLNLDRISGHRPVPVGIVYQTIRGMHSLAGLAEPTEIADDVNSAQDRLQRVGSAALPSKMDDVAHRVASHPEGDNEEEQSDADDAGRC